MNNQKLNYLEASFLIIIVTITHLVLNMPDNLIESTGSSAILNCVYVTVLALIFFAILNKLLSPFDNKNILYVAEFVGGKILSRLLGFLYVFHFTFTAGILLRNFSEVLKIIYFPQAPTWTTLSAFIIVALIVNKFGSKNVVKANAILMVPILSTILVTALSLFGKFEVNRIFPVVGYGFFETFVKGSSNIYAFSGILYLLLIRPNLKRSEDFSKVGYISLVICGVYLISVVGALLLLFPYIPSGNQTLSVYLATRIVNYGKFMQRVDAVYMFVWIFVFLSYLSVIIMFIRQIGKSILSSRLSNYYTYIIGLFVFLVAIFPSNTVQLRFMETTLYKYASIGVIFISSVIILGLGYIKKRKV